MNERIQELAKQATVHGNTEHHLDIPSWYLEQFAEMIVKECMTMCDELQAQYLTSRKSTMDFDEKQIYAEGEAACDIVKYKMKKQFGVE
jgi:hypothetical protein